MAKALGARVLQGLRSVKPVTARDMFAELKQDIKGIKQDVQILQSDVWHVKNEVQHVKNEVQVLNKDVCTLTQTVGRLESKFGSSLEAQIRGEVSRMFGTSYSKQYTARSIIDIVNLLPDAAKPCTEMVRDPHFKLLEAARFVAHRLVEERVPINMLSAIWHFMTLHGYHSSQELWTRKDGTVDAAAMGDAIHWLSDKLPKPPKGNKEKLKQNVWSRVHSAMVRLKLYFENPSMDSLTSCEGVGLMCVVAAANGFTTNDGAPLLVSEVEFDVKGKVSIHVCDTFTMNPLHAMIETGEIKSRPDYSSAVKQLGLRLDVLKWAIQTMFPQEKRMLLICIGHLFLCKSLLGEVEVDEEQKKIAAEAGYSLFVHSV